MILPASVQAQFQALLKHCYLSQRPLSTTIYIIQTGDRVLLQSKGRDPFLTKPLRLDSSTSTQYGELKHANIIGKRARDTVTSSKGSELRVFRPSLAEYVTLTPRNVTPVYPADANLIVSLLDLHIGPSEGVKEAPLEILEAGTGHGALTLYLARAIHGANAPSICEEGTTTSDDVICNETSDVPSEEKLQSTEVNSGAKAPSRYDHQNDQRQAVIHTIDVSPKHRKDARAIVKGFRQGMYLKNIEFHVGDVSEWIDQQTTSRSPDAKDTTFLSHIVLDTPSADQHIGKAASALHVNGSLLAFNPSITQIMTIVEIIKLRDLPLQLDKVIELGASMTGGREWDIRAVKPRALGRVAAEKGRAGTVGESGVQNIGNSADNDSTINDTGSEINDDEKSQAHRQERDWVVVCRPKVGDRIAGGGFLGMWKKMRW